MSSPTFVLSPSVVPPMSALPLSVQKYAATGVAPSPLRRDLVTVSNQVPRWAYAGVALGSAWMAYKAYGEWKKKQGIRDVVTW